MPRFLISGGGTGGHLYPALNLAAALERASDEVECFFLGAERGIEARILPERKYPFRLLPMQPFHRAVPIRNWRLLASAPGVVSGVRSAMREFRPDVVVGTGGYASAPAVMMATLGRTPSAIQEQNALPGMVTRLLASRVDRLYLGYPEARERLDLPPRVEVLAFGNPVALEPPSEPFPWPEPPVVLVMGGSQGARGINQRLLGDLERVGDGPVAAAESGPCARQGPGGMSPATTAPAVSRGWPRGVSLVWVPGPAHAEEVERRVADLPMADRITVVPYIDELGAQLDRATLIVSRAGAMSTAEICAAGRPSVLVPLPTAAEDHQTANARSLERAGACVALAETELGPGDLWGACVSLLDRPDRLEAMSEAARSRGRPDAADRIARDLLELAGRAHA